MRQPSQSVARAYSQSRAAVHELKQRNSCKTGSESAPRLSIRPDRDVFQMLGGRHAERACYRTSSCD
jgi:hypothetical protein